MTRHARIAHPKLKSRIMSAEDAAGLISDGMTVGMSGFTGSGYPKSVPMALAARIEAEHAAGNPFRVKVWTGASTGPELDGALAKADGIEFRLPYNSDPIAREKINAGEMNYFDMHLSQVAPMAWQGFLGKLDVAVVEISGITEEGALIPSSSIGNNKTWLDRADRVILELNRWQSDALNGMHDIYYGTALPPCMCTLTPTLVNPTQCDRHCEPGVPSATYPKCPSKPFFYNFFFFMRWVWPQAFLEFRKYYDGSADLVELVKEAVQHKAVAGGDIACFFATLPSFLLVVGGLITLLSMVPSILQRLLHAALKIFFASNIMFLCLCIINKITTSTVYANNIFFTNRILNTIK